jgi:hypothetical protein
MKSFTINLMLATAAVMVASSAAMAAGPVKFEILFAFPVGDKTMVPGAYTVRAADNEPFFVIANAQTGKKVFVSSVSPHDPQKEWRTSNGGALQFECGEEGKVYGSGFDSGCEFEAGAIVRCRKS